MKLKTVVRRLRELAGDGKRLSVREFAKRLHVSHTAIVEWESGKDVGSFNKLRLLTLARDLSAPDEIVATLVAAQDEVRA